MVGRKALVELSEQIFTTESYCRADLSKPESVEKIVTFLNARKIARLRGVIHNAALGWVGEMAEQALENVKMLTEVNLVAPIRLTQTLWNRAERVIFLPVPGKRAIRFMCRIC